MARLFAEVLRVFALFLDEILELLDVPLYHLETVIAYLGLVYAYGLFSYGLYVGMDHINMPAECAALPSGNTYHLYSYGL